MTLLPRISALRALAACLAACVVCTVGCNYVIPAMWIAQGPPKKPAVYTLPKDLKTTVFVDDRKNVISRTQLRAQLADDIATELTTQGLVSNVVSGRELIAFVRRTETPSKRVSIEDLGNAVGADVVIYVEMLTFDLMADGATPRPSASARIKVVDVKSKERLFPPTGGDKQGFEVSAETEALQPGIYRTSAGRRTVEDMLEKKLGDAIVKLFYDHEPRNFGQGVSGLGN
ncbi:MAG: hypothetical protein JNK53_00840 [Phycisphaerae bacterium]|nr:hypothetical protein [Phycisphaerae bacterium]